jgi:hypothetical protein
MSFKIVNTDFIIKYNVDNRSYLQFKLKTILLDIQYINIPMIIPRLLE